jgi:hypothetical protein
VSVHQYYTIFQLSPLCRYQPYDKNAHRPLEFLVTAPSGLAAAILNCHQRGIALDSSWRHKNQNVAPLSLLTTVDESNKMVPGKLSSLMSRPYLTSDCSVFLVLAAITSDVRASTLVDVLEQTKQAVEKVAAKFKGKL